MTVNPLINDPDHLDSPTDEPDLNGITINGVQASQWIEGRRRDLKNCQIQGLINDQQYIHHGKHRPMRAKPIEPTRRVSRRVTRLSDRQIRKEYGLMAKPFESHNENIIYTIFEKGPINCTQIGEAIQFEGGMSSLSALVSTIWRRLGDDGADVIERARRPGEIAYNYQKKTGVDLSVEAAIERFKIFGSREMQRRREQKRQAAESNSPIDLPSDSDPNPNQTPGNTLAAEALATLGRQVATATASPFSSAHDSPSMNINLTGKIEFVFKIG